MEKFDLEPIDDKVVIKPKDPDTISAGGVFIPEGSQPEAICGTVVSVGPGAHRFGAVTGNERYGMKCKKGDLVYYPKFGAHKLEFEGEEFVVIKEGDLFLRIPYDDTPVPNKEAIKEVLSKIKPLSEDE